MTTPWEYLVNGSMIRAAYEAYNVPFSFHGQAGYPIGILFIIFLFLMYLQNRSIAFNFVMGLIGFAVIFVMIPPLMKGMIAIILVLELGGVIYDWIVRE